MNLNMTSFDDTSTLLELDQYRTSPQPAAGASRPKKCFTTPKGEVYFKFHLTNNEICAELFSFWIGRKLGIPMAETKLAKSANIIGIASYDIGAYYEPDDRGSYSIKDFLHVQGFIQMCLFDYLIMNEDRHAGNWGFANGKVAPLFDHNYCFGGPDGIVDVKHFMAGVTSAFYVTDENKQRHDTLLSYFVKYHRLEVAAFMKKVLSMTEIADSLLWQYFDTDCTQLNKVLAARIEYMKIKVGEFVGRQINDNEF